MTARYAVLLVPVTVLVTLLSQVTVLVTLLTPVTVLVTLDGGPASALPAQAEPFPQPVVAPVFQDGSTPAALAASSVAVDTTGGAASVRIRFEAPFGLPGAGDYRVSLVLGDPEGEQRRYSLVVEAGVELGVAEKVVVDDDEGTVWEATGALMASFDRRAGVTLALPEDEVPAPDDLAWVDLELVSEGGATPQRFLGPLVPAVELFGASEGASVAPRAWGSVDRQPPDPSVEVADPPRVDRDGEHLVLTFAGALPDEVGGREVANVVDVIRIADGFSGRGQAPYLVTVDHGKGSVSLLDGAGAFPVEVNSVAPWLVSGLPTTALQAGSQIVVSLPSLVDAFGLTGDSDTVAVGVARSITLEDGDVIRADGVLVTGAWLGSAPQTEPGTTTTAVAAPTDPDSSGGDDLAVAVVAAVVAVLGVGALAGLRVHEHRRHRQVAGTLPTTLPPVVAPDGDEQARLDAWSDELFGPSPR